MNGEVFLGLPNLNDVSLIDNVCIDESFHHRQKIEGMTDKITTKCGFDDSTESNKNENLVEEKINEVPRIFKELFPSFSRRANSFLSGK
jgi:hypothetical protein